MFTFLLVHLILKAFFIKPTDVSHQWISQLCTVFHHFQKHSNNMKIIISLLFASDDFENDKNDDQNYSTDESTHIKGPCCLRCLLGCNSLAKGIRILCLSGQNKVFLSTL